MDIRFGFVMPVDRHGLSALAMTNRRGLAMTKSELFSAEPVDQFRKGPGPMADLGFFVQGNLRKS